MAVTPEQARAELERRRQITPEQARAELERRRSGPSGTAGLPHTNVLAVPEIALQGITGIGGQIGGGIAGIVAGAIPGGATAEEAVDVVQDFFTYQPRTQQAQAIGESISEFAEPIMQGIADVPYLQQEDEPISIGGPLGGFEISEEPRESVNPALGALWQAAAIGGPEIAGLRAGRLAPAEAPQGFVPSIDDMYSIGRVAFDEARIHGSGIRPEALERVGNRVRNVANRTGQRIDFDPDLHPGPYKVRQRMLSDFESGNVDFDNLMTLRELAGDLAAKPDADIAMRGMVLKNELDDFVNSLTPDDVVSGDPVRAAAALNSARQFWRDASAARTIQETIELAGNQAGQFTGSGFENALRTKFRQLHARIIRGYERGFTPDEIAEIRRVSEGGTTANIARAIGRWAPTGVVSTGIGTAAGFGVGGPLGAAAVPAAGALGRWLAERTTSGQAQRALEAPLRRSLLEPDE